MTIRLHEVHPSLVHLPLTLVPMALALDGIGQLTGSRALSDTGRSLMPVAAASALVTGAAGYVAQGAVNAQGDAHQLLVTHRNLNTAVVALTAALAAVRLKSARPGLGYWLAAAGSVAAMSYTAYLGGKMVYAHRVGVAPDGVRLESSPEIRPGSLSTAAELAVRQGARQVTQAAREAAAGELAPALRASRKAHVEAGRESAVEPERRAATRDTRRTRFPLGRQRRDDRAASPSVFLGPY